MLTIDKNSELSIMNILDLAKKKIGVQVKYIA